TCVIKADSTVACWGFDGHDDRYSPPIPPDGRIAPPPGTFRQISAGYAHTCGVRTDGTVACWGQNSQDGQATAPAGSFRQVSAIDHATCGLLTDGTAECWGWGWYPSPGWGWPASGKYTAISMASTAFDGVVCALQSDGTPYCASKGYGTYGLAL